jgi:hypothetical protein
MTSSLLTDQQIKQVLARADYRCQPAKPGCTLTADTIEPARTPEQLEAQRRDINHPDNWHAVCSNCQRDGS